MPNLNLMIAVSLTLVFIAGVSLGIGLAISNRLIDETFKRIGE